MKKTIWLLIIIMGLSGWQHASAQTQPPRVNIVWESDGYVPLEYAGKALVTTGSTVRVIALSDIKNLEYYWRLDDYELPDYSGLERSSFTFTATKAPGNSHLVALTIKEDGQIALRQTATIPVVAPLLAFYEQDPILGEVFNKAISGKYNLAKPEITLVAEPFFFNRADANFLKYTWKLNGQQVSPDGGNGRVITFTTPASGGQGENEVKLLAENPSNVLQYVQNSFSIVFNSLNSNETIF